MSHMSDCVLVCEDGEVPASKFLLACQSEVFHTMFSHNTDEAKTGRVVIKDCSSAAILALYEFICCGLVENLDEIVDELYLAANKYGIANLENICLVNMHESLSTMNACRRQIIAKFYNLDTLKEAALKFILKNHYDIEFGDLDQLNDCALECEDGEVQVCSFLLASQSTVFSHFIFNTKMSDFCINPFRIAFPGVPSKLNAQRISVKDYSRTIMKKLYWLICCGKVEDLAEIDEELFAVADKFGLI